ncbi:hypothetical protein [Dyadobacter sp. CY323]|uniref:hypothetical protein n=1 Tax=Dyadobacter sp. CY323 TaxID=2907302 RepID=UPI001F336A10|nr:hypothetical protein [Dyadobacter sp. CY323]MCE6987814.1 hypothetical protein [Dyadobacter sp. CY323]
MKSLKITASILALSIGLSLASCGTEKNDMEGSAGSGSESQTTPNDSSSASSRTADGIGEDNQNDSLGYPPNQSNLNADSTRQKHDN